MDNGECVIGMKSVAMIPLITFDTIVNVYLTIMFLIPLKSRSSLTCHSAILTISSSRSILVQEHANDARKPPSTNSGASYLCRRSMHFGQQHCVRLPKSRVVSLLTDPRNLSVLMALDGEPGWVCLMCCNCDSEVPCLSSRRVPANGPVLFSVIVIQCITSKDNAASPSPSPSAVSGGAYRAPACGARRITSDSPTRPCVLDLDITPGPSPHVIALKPTSSSFHRISDYTDDDFDTHHVYDIGAVTAATTPTSPGAVVVTTTISRQSKPGSINGLVEDITEGAHTLSITSADEYGWETQRTSRGGSSTAALEGITPPLTRITGGVRSSESDPGSMITHSYQPMNRRRS